MGFSAQKYRKERQERPWKINPVWRGIGCLLIIMIPIMSWFAAQLVMQSNTSLPIPADMKKVVTINYVHVAQVDQVIADVNRYSATHGLLAGQLFFTVLLMVVGFGLLSVVYAIMYRIAGPPRYGPFDVPPGR